MKRLLTILFLVSFVTAFTQQGSFDYLQAYRRFTLAKYPVKGISNDTSFLIGSADSLVTQYAIKGYLLNHYGPGTNNIFGDAHQLLGAKYDNTNILEFLDPLVEGNFVTSDSELTAAKLQFVDQETVFNSWKRFSHGSGDVGQPVPSDTIPGVPLQTNSWSFDATSRQITSTFNSSTHIGFVSGDKYSNYVSSFTMRATGSDNDYVTSIIAYVEDANDMVRNNAYGLNPANFNWPINTTDQLIPNQHTITLVRGRTDQPNFPFATPIRYAIVYDLGKLTEQVLVNGENLVWNTNLAYGAGAECDVKVIRTGDIIKAYTTNWSDAPGGKGSLSYELMIDLSSNPLTQKFRGSASYGYGAMSQQNATFSNLSVSPNRNTIYDLRNGDKWTADYNGNYSLDTGSYYNDYGVRRFLYNPYTLKTFYVKADKTFDVLGSGDVNQFTSDTTIVNNYNNYTNIVAGDSAYLDSRDFSDTGTVTDPIRTKPLILVTTRTSGAATYNHDTKVLDIPQYAGGSSYTDAQARAAISLTTTGTSGAATYNSSTGVLNIPQYSGSGGFTGWGLNGNSINPATDYIGTNSNNSFRFRTNGIERGKIDSTGKFTINGNSLLGLTTSNVVQLGNGIEFNYSGGSRIFSGGKIIIQSNATSSQQVTVENGIQNSFTSGDVFSVIGGSQQSTSGVTNFSKITGRAAQASGNQELNFFNIEGRVDQQGSATGQTRFIYINPIVTGVLGKLKAIETTSGDIIFKNLPVYTSNAAAISDGKEVGTVYRNGDDLKIVH